MNIYIRGNINNDNLNIMAEQGLNNLLIYLLEYQLLVIIRVWITFL